MTKTKQQVEQTVLGLHRRHLCHARPTCYTRWNQEKKSRKGKEKCDGMLQIATPMV